MGKAYTLMTAMRNAQSILVRKPEGRLLGRTRHRQQDNFKNGSQSQDADWILKAQDGLGKSCDDDNENSQTEFWAKLYNTDYYLTQGPKRMFRNTSLNI